MSRGAAYEKVVSIVASLEEMSGCRLPAERDLAGDLGVSRGALRRALARLESEGRIWRHVGRGTFIGQRPDNDRHGVDAFPKTLSPPEVMEARRLLEPNIARLAAVRSTIADIERMEECLRKGEAATDIASFELWDSLLHQAIAKGAHNGLLLMVFDIINAGRDNALWGKIKKQSLTKTRMQRHAREHANIVGAIRARDAARACQLMQEHLDFISREIFEKSGVAFIP